jgi:hypothetical protein
VIAPGYLSEAQAQSVLKRAAGVVVSHSAEDVIVTGSFFYAISANRPVYAVATPFLRAIQAQVGPQVLQTAQDVPGLCQLLAEHCHGSAPSAAVWSAVRAAFSDTTICRHLAAIFQHLGLLQVGEEVMDSEELAGVAE